MEENKQMERKVIKISKKKLIWGFVILVIVLIFWIVAMLMSSFSTARNKGDVMSLNSYGDSNSIIPEMMPPNNYDDYRYQDQNSSITDTREFMKTSYSSTIKTRNVSDVIKQVKNIVKGADGRVDEINTSEKYGRVRFVVAKSKFDDFRDEIESITHKKLYTESISSNNLLNEKQGIEGQILDANQSLDSLISQRTELNNNHTKIVNSINKELSKINDELVKVRAIISVEKNPQISASLRTQETSWVGQQSYQKKKLSDENNMYVSKLQNFDAMINNASNNLTDANKKDIKFGDNIETVNGYVSAQWVSIWEMAVIFSPIHPTWIIIILIIAGFILFRKRMPKVEIV